MVSKTPESHTVCFENPKSKEKGTESRKKKKKVSHDYQEAMTIQGEQTGILKNKLKECPGKLA